MKREMVNAASILLKRDPAASSAAFVSSLFFSFGVDGPETHSGKLFFNV